MPILYAQTGFENTLEDRINQYFKKTGKSKKADNFAWFKLWVIVLFWFSSLFLIYSIKTSFIGYLFFYLLHGIASLLVIFNISHDAVHQTLSSKKWINGLFGYTFNLVGGNKYSWFLKHNIGHHKFTNIHGGDIDIETTPFFRVSPHTPIKWHYRLQHIYIIPLYCLMSLLLIFAFDVIVMLKTSPRFDSKHPLNEWIILVFSKVFYLTYLLVFPILWLPISPYEVLFCFLSMHAILGLAISLVLFHHILSKMLFIIKQLKI